MKTTSPTILLILLVTSLANGEIRSWKNTDGTRTLEADFLSRDESSVTLRRVDGRVVSLNLEKLHQNDRSFLNQNHPYLTPENEKEPEGDAFGPLQFGDSRTEVEEKLLASSVVKTDVKKTLFGRTGLNGIFQTSQSIGGLHCFLYFDWNKSGNLQEVTLRTKALNATSYNDQLQSTWSELISLLNKLYGKPVSNASFPKQQELQDGLMLASHLWRTTDGYSVLLGSSQERSKYNVSVRFTTKRIQPVAIP